MQIDFSSLLVRPPGDLLYFLAIMVLNLAGLGMAYGFRLRNQSDRAAGRFVLAAAGTVIGWFVLMLGALFALTTNISSDAILPLLERVVQTGAIAIAAWAFATATHERWGRTPNILLLGGLLILALAYVFQSSDWSFSYARIDFNLSQLGLIWTIVPILLTIICALLMLAFYSLILDAPLKLVYFVLLLPGFVGTLIQMAQGNIIGDYAGLVRLSSLASAAILPAVIYRHIVFSLDRSRQEKLVDASASVVVTGAPPVVGAPTVSAPAAAPSGDRESAQLMRALGMMLENATPLDIPERIVTTAMNMLKADIGVMLSVNSATHVDVMFGHDRVMERAIADASLNLDEQPTLVNAIERRQQRPLFPDRNVEELRDLYGRFDIEALGPTYIQPLVNDNSLTAILLLGMPYTRRELTDSERELLKGIAIISAKLLALSRASSRSAEQGAEGAYETAPAEESVFPDERLRALTTDLESARNQIEQLSGHVTGLKVELDYERERIATTLEDTEETQSISQRIATLVDEQQRLVDERDRLAGRLRDAETALIGVVSTDSDAMLKSMIAVLQNERDDLTAERDRLQAQIETLRSGAPIPVVVHDLLERLSREKAQLEQERTALQQRLTGIEDQLHSLGVTDGAHGLAQLIQSLYEQRASLQVKFDQVKAERDTLVQERQRVEVAIREEDERQKKLSALQVQINYLAADREAALKQRDRLRTERDELATRQQAVQDRYARVMAEIASFEQEVAELRSEQKDQKDTIRSLREQQSELSSERDRLMAQLRAIEVERDQLTSRVEGDRERMQSVNANGVGALVQMIEELTQQRIRLEKQLRAAESATGDAIDQLGRLERRAGEPASTLVEEMRQEDSAAVLGMIQELRTPLTSIIGYVDLLLNETAGILGEMQRRFLQRVLSNASRLTQMLEDLARLVTMETGDIVLMPERVNPVTIIEDAITHATPQLRERSIILNLDLPENAPMIRGDTDALKQVMTQLLTNAYLTSPQGGEITIWAAPIHNQGVFIISVSDEGGGVDPGDETRVFARRYKADNPLLQGIGDSGVGLAIAKALVEAHGGHISLESSPGVGTTFRVELPIDVVHEPE
ncbi:MAG: hypothetical protein IPK19_32040 [Chloroflexi bacterium]|nr:hypothetical protein [Chloroflexota bacterium]